MKDLIVLNRLRTSGSNRKLPVSAIYRTYIFGLRLLTLTRPIGVPPHAQKIADLRWLIANSAKNRYLFI